MTVVLWGIGGAIALAVLIAAFRTKHPIKGLLSGAAQGLCALAAVNILGSVTGVTVGLTTFTALVCAVLGIPGVATLLALNAIFFL